MKIMKNKLVSIIITTYNRPFSMLKKAIESVINQTYDNIEIIIVDDNGDKKRKELDIESNINKFDRVLYIKNRDNVGPSKARNIGINYSNGYYIAFLDDDDEYEKTKIEKQVKKMEASKSEVGLINIGYKRININKKKERVIYPPKIEGNGLDYLVENGNYIIYPLIKKECFDKVGLFNEELKHSEDYEMWLRILKTYSISYVYEPLALYYFHNNDNLTYNYAYFIDANKKIEEIHKDVFKQNKNAKYNLYTSRAKAFAHNGNTKASFETYSLAVKCRPFNIIKNICNLIHIFYILL